MKKYLLYIFRYVIGVVLIVAAIPKIAEPELFIKAIEAYKILPNYLINLTGLMIPWIELLTGLFLIIGFMLRGSSILAVTLFFAFSIFIGVGLLRGLSIDCGCFGAVNSPLTVNRLIEDLIFLSISAYISYFYLHEKQMK